MPKTWAEFMANNEKIKAAGKTAVIQSFGVGSTWTSQLFVLGDFFNVQAAVPNFAADYTAGKAKYAETPAAVKGFQYGEDVFKAGYLNEDFAVATFEEARRQGRNRRGRSLPDAELRGLDDPAPQPRERRRCRLLRHSGRRCHEEWPHRVDAGRHLHPQDRPSTPRKPRSSSPMWPRLPAAISRPPPLAPPDRTSSRAALCPTDVPPVVADLLPYFQQEGTTAPALEFVSPIKGPNLEQITVEVGSGIRPAAEAAALYDEDVRKQAMQLGLPGWN